MAPATTDRLKTTDRARPSNRPLVRVRIPRAFQGLTEGCTILEIRATTAGAVLDALAEQHPVLRSRIQLPDGNLARGVNLFLGDEPLTDLEQAIEVDSELSILPALAGG